MVYSVNSSNPGSPWARIIYLLWGVVLVVTVIVLVVSTIQVIHPQITSQPPIINSPTTDGVTANHKLMVDPHAISKLQAAALLGFCAFGCWIYQMIYTALRRQIKPVDAIDITTIPASSASLTNEPQEYAAAAASGLVQLAQNQQITIGSSSGITDVQISCWPLSGAHPVDTEFIARSLDSTPCDSDAIQQMRLDPKTAAKLSKDIYGKYCRWLHRPDMKGWPFLFCLLFSVGSVVLSSQVIELHTWKLIHQYDLSAYGCLMLILLSGFADDIARSKPNLFRPLFIVGMAISTLLMCSDSISSAVQALPVVLSFLCLASATLVPQINSTVHKLKSQLKTYQIQLNAKSHEQKMEYFERHPDERVIAVVLGVCPAEMAVNRQFRELTHMIKYPGKGNLGK